jgi:hypothetical protein
MPELHCRFIKNCKNMQNRRHSRRDDRCTRGIAAQMAPELAHAELGYVSRAELATVRSKPDLRVGGLFPRGSDE